MYKDVVSYELAKKLQEKGFVEQCVCYYDMRGELGYNIENPISDRMLYSWNKDKTSWNGGNCDAPTISQALRWLRDAKRLSIEPFYGTVRIGNHIVDDMIKPCWRCCVVPVDFYGFRCDKAAFDVEFESWEDAMTSGIEYALDYLI